MMHALQKFLLFHFLTCLRPNALGSEIIYGQLAPPKSFQFMASLQDIFGTHGCGGSLISDSFVLTAAHCDDPDFTPVRVVLGTHNLRNPRAMRGIAQMCKHPDYVSVQEGNDIMLLKLSQKVSIGRGIQYIGLAPPDMNMAENQVCRVAGWGVTETGRGAVHLRFLDVPVINQSVCRQRWREMDDVIPDNIICAGGYGTFKGACNGDSGGPLVYNRTVVGVVSFANIGCDNPRLPNGYTDVSKFRPWIDEVLSQNGC